MGNGRNNYIRISSKLTAQLVLDFDFEIYLSRNLKKSNHFQFTPRLSFMYVNSMRLVMSSCLPMDVLGVTKSILSGNDSIRGFNLF